MSGERSDNSGCLEYAQVRSQIRTGDIFLFRGEGLLSRFIRWGSKSEYSHAGMAAWWGNRLAVFQAVGHGVQLVPMSAAVEKYPGQVDWWTLVPELDSDFKRELIIDHAMTQLGKSYASLSLVQLVYRMAINRFRGLPDPEAHPNTLFCSQYVSWTYREAGLDLRPDTPDRATSPGDLATSGRLLLKGVIHRQGRAGPQRERSDTSRAARPPVVAA